MHIALSINKKEEPNQEYLNKLKAELIKNNINNKIQSIVRKKLSLQKYFKEIARKYLKKKYLSLKDSLIDVYATDLFNIFKVELINEVISLKDKNLTNKIKFILETDEELQEMIKLYNPEDRIRKKEKYFNTSNKL